MKFLPLNFIAFISCAVLIFQFCGCTSKETYYERTARAREVAYEKWKNRESDPQSQVLINGDLSIEDTLKLTLLHNKALQIVLEEKTIAKGEELKSYSAALPSVDIIGNYTRKDNVASLGPITFGSLNNYSVGLNVSQPVFAGGSIIATINSARLASLLTDEAVRTAFEDAIYNSYHLYYDVLLNQHLFDITADAIRSSKAQLDYTRKRRQAGVASDFDVLRAEVELSNFEAEHIRNRNSINIAKASLLKVMGVSQDSKIDLTDELIYTPSQITMEQAVEAAFKNRPDLFGRQLDITLQNELLNIARSRYFPTIRATQTNTWAKPDPQNSTRIDWGFAKQAGLTATFPLFDGFAREGEIIQQQARFRQANINLTDAEETALFELAKAQLVIEDAEEFVESQRLSSTQAKTGLDLAQLGYEQGINTQVETIDAQAALTEAQAFYYQAIYSHVVAKLDLQRAMGSLAAVEQPLPQNHDVTLEYTNNEEPSSQQDGQEKNK